MKFLIFTVLSMLLFHHVVSEKEEEEKDYNNCEEATDTFLLSFLYGTSNPQKCTDVNFYLGVKNDNTSLKIGDGNWTALKSEHFKPSQKTYFIIHGYRSNYQKTWIRNLKDTLLEHRNINLILVDWKKGSNKWNYVNSVLFSQKLKFVIAGFLNDLKKEVKKAYNSTDGEWNKLYFIGHSLGAHISGQTGHLIRSAGKGFYKIERITGLDPAQPCFTKADDTLRLDKTDADFVDVIHTQTGTGEGISGLGLKESIGHIDFYVNGGVHQSDCLGSRWATEINRMICSHKIACRYFIESIDSEEYKDCKFVGYKWDRSYEDAVRILKKAEKGHSCSDCPKMGIESSKSSGNGSYLVLTPDKQPHCSKSFETSGLEKLKKAIDKLNDKKSSIFGSADAWDIFNNF